MSDFVKELNFDGDTFNDMKRDMNFVLQRLLGNMQEKECQEGTLTLKLDVSLVREYVPNYNPNIPGESTAKQINMVLVHPIAVITPISYEFAQLDPPSAGSQGKYDYFEESFEDVFILPHKMDAIDFHVNA